MQRGVGARKGREGIPGPEGGRGRGLGGGGGGVEGAGNDVGQGGIGHQEQGHRQDEKSKAMARMEYDTCQDRTTVDVSDGEG